MTSFSTMTLETIRTDVLGSVNGIARVRLTAGGAVEITTAPMGEDRQDTTDADIAQAMKGAGFEMADSGAADPGYFSVWTSETVDVRA